MEEASVALLACPHCGLGLRERGAALACASGHSFDRARQGYVSLLSAGSRTDTADTAAMVAARARFLSRGHFDSVAHEMARLSSENVPASSPGAVVDVGAGTGWLLARVLDALPGRAGIALDSSKHAARRAASAHPRAFSAVCDAWDRLPVVSGGAALVLSFFAPRNPLEFRRILAPGGLVAVMTPGAEHLAELRVPLGLISVDTRKSERLGRSFGDLFEQIATHHVRYVMRLTREDAADVAGMGPSAHHRDPHELSRAVASLPSVTPVTAAVDVRLFRGLAVTAV